MVTEIGFDAPPPVADVIRALGRTEDLSFSPDNRRLAVAAFTRNRIVVFDIDVGASTGHAHVRLTGSVELASPALQHPHGVDFLDDDTVIVTNRDGHVVIISLPPGKTGVQVVEATTIATWRADSSTPLDAPGSVWVQHSAGAREVLICNNDAHTVTKHTLDGNDWRVPPRTDVLLHRHLDVPDGVSVSADRRWIAVSNHTSHDVLVYERTPSTTSPDPQGILHGVRYPHGLCFGPEDKSLFVADAGAPFVHVFVPDGDDWRGVRSPSMSFRVMDDETFARGAHTMESGGPKGLDIDASGNIGAITSEAQPLLFFSVPACVEEAGPGHADSASKAAAFHYALWRIDATHERARRVREYGALIRYLRSSRSWRLTEPLRWLDSVLKRSR
jgi:sugar lactone lactonase YvrE